ncbi:DUF1631 domain-containing protein [Acidovorax sp. GBBC 3334]|uniref:DUF1631 family protein n=1 Tax=Acidovorax sp. GBBC 3334 TaxID=2940496 RepID=UPI002304A962|nr:DUF1631 family protein [Acidovorax sp. GBBC 3334]MDA8456406.1 DUF1631 domain-containing protein [Acidovorax sp. GBBC 3334]
MSASAPSVRSAFRACVVAAIRDGEALMAALLEATRVALDVEVSHARELRRRDALADAQRLLVKHVPALAKAYPMALLEIFAEGPATARARPADASGLDFGELSLMDEAEVMAQVELSRAQQVALHATEAVLAELNTLVSAAQGLRSVQPDRNPLRPENYIRALQQVVGETGVSPDVRTAWMAPMRDALGVQLQAAYQRAVERLRADGVQPVGYAVAAGGAGSNARTSAASRWQGPQSGYDAGMQAAPWDARSSLGAPLPSSSGYGVPGNGWGGGAAVSQPMPLAAEAEEALLTVAMLRQMLAQPMALSMPVPPPLQQGLPVPGGRMSQPGALHGLPSLPVTQGGGLAAAAVEAMEDIAELERIVGRLSGSLPAPLAAGSAIPAAQLQAAGSSLYAGVASQVGPVAPGEDAAAPLRARSRTASEVVSRMMDNIALDDRLLPPVQRALQNLRPALQRLVRHDRRFFTDDQHPARRLLDVLTQRALSFDSEDVDDFSGFVRLMDLAVDHLANGDTRNAEAFSTALAGLEAGWSAQDRQRQDREDAARAVALELTRREELARRVAEDIRALAKTDDVPQDIVDFAAGPWADVVANAQAGQAGTGDPDPGGYLALVPELFWLAQPAAAAQEPERLATTITRMLGTLRQGLDSVGHAEDMTSTILERVAALHQTAAEHASRYGPGPLEDDAPDTGGSLLGPDADGHEEDMTGDGEEGSAPPADAATAPGVDGVADLAIGTWVELVTNHRAVHTQLTWASPHHTLFLFTAPDGSTQSMTRRVRDKLMGEGALKVLPGPPAAVRGRSQGRSPGSQRNRSR